MGRPIVYCADCGTSLPETEFEQGRARMADNRPYCSTCRPPSPKPVPEPALSTATPRRPIAPRTARVPVTRPPSRLPLWLAAGGGGVVLLAVVLVLLTGPADPPVAGPAPPPAPPPKPDDSAHRLEADRARAEAEKLDGFLKEIRGVLAGDAPAKRKGEVESMLRSAMEIAGGRRREVDELRAEFERRLLQAELRASLVGHWPLDAGLGKIAVDASGRNQAGQLRKEPRRLEGQIAGGLGLDGDDYVELPNSPVLDKVQEGSYTLAAWFRPDREPAGKDRANNAAFGILVKDGYHGGLSYMNGGRFSMNHYLAGNKEGGLSADPGRHPPGRFYHVAGTVDREAGETQLYVDGALEKKREFPAKTAGRDYKKAKWRIGIGKPGAAEYAWPARGIVDDVRIFDRALAAREVEFLYREGKAGRAP